ncbi:MAG: Rpn family recombination-promoting nuclease/putative transposase [Treponema bryantii]|nr:Rpn family recombination-promoting nuclease/putative transposase [Treponema bryantii]
MENRNHKDSLFIDLFCKDQKSGKENFISLYNALHQTNLNLETTTLEEVNIENILYMALSNDIAILVDDRLIVLVEHQSTINENMPLRLLEYVSRIYEQIIPSEDRYEKKMIKIPYPEFYVFYNGTDEYPVEKELKLSDAFILPDNKYSKDKKISLEILVKVININIDKENPILKQCRALQEYSTLIELIRETKRQNPNAPLEEALSKAINDGILEDYLKRKSTEVRNMLIAEYSYETDIKVQRREAFRLGKEEGAEQKAIEAAKKFIKMGLPIDQISEGIGLSKEEVQKLAEENNK